MGKIAPTYDDRVRYTLSHNEYGHKVITDPVGWREDEKEYARNNDYHGVFAKFSNSLRFVDDGAEYIQNVYAIYGINAEIRLIREEQHPHTDKWTRSYEGYLDLSTYELEKGQVSVKFNAGGIEKMLKARDTDDVEIERENTIDGGMLPPLNPKEVRIEGRRIFLESKLDVTEDSTNRSAGTIVESNAGNERHQTVGIPLNAVVNSHQNIMKTVTPEIKGTRFKGDLGMMFMFDVSRKRTFSIDLTVAFTAFIQQYEHVNWATYHVCLTTYKNGFEFDLKDRKALYMLENAHPGFGGGGFTDLQQIAQYPKWPVSASYQNSNFTLLPGESLALECHLGSDMDVNPNAGVRVFAEDIIAAVKIEEDSSFPDSDSKFILAHELGERLVHILTNRKNAFYSKALGRTDIGYSEDGKEALTGFAHGMWIRKFDKEPENDDNRYKAFATSFKDYMQSLSAIWNLGMGIEKVGYRERVRVEPLSYFYNRKTTIKLPNQVKKVKRTIAKEFYYSALEIGYEKGGEYEEAMGLDEYNARTHFNTNITAIKKTFSRVSKYRADSYGLEFARRKPIDLFPTEDTSYDQDIFAMDLYRWIGNSKFKLRHWEKDFDSMPTGVFSPETAFNLRFSPVNMLFRHGWVISAGLVKYATDYIRYGSSTANSKLKTRMNSANRYENGDIINSELTAPRFVPEWIEFDHHLDFELNQKLEGKTMVDGEEIPNFYGRIEFLNENNEWEKGYLFSVKPDKGKWKLLKAYR